MRGDPCIERREWFFEQRQLLDSSLVRSGDRQLAGLFIEGRRYCQDDMVPIQPPLLSSLRVFVIPAVADVCEQARRRFHRRESWAAFATPGQEGGGSIDARIRQPRLRGRDLPRGHERSLVSRERADDQVR
jgi:hypothetical protein